MCGIAGYLHFDKNCPASDDVLKKMIDVIIHRGPDDEGIFIYRNLALGHRVLSSLNAYKRVGVTYIRWTLRSTIGGQFLLYSSFLNGTNANRKTDPTIRWFGQITRRATDGVAWWNKERRPIKSRGRLNCGGLYHNP